MPPELSPQESSPRPERRQAPRFPLALAVKLEHGEGRTRDISTSGVFLTTQGPFSPGAHVQFILELEHVDPSGSLHITYEGHVVRVEPRPNAIGVGVSIAAYDFGVREIWGTIPWAAKEPDPIPSQAGDRFTFHALAPNAHKKGRAQHQLPVPALQDQSGKRRAPDHA